MSGVSYSQPPLIQLWEVTGGETCGGVPVCLQQGPASPKHPERLATGSIIKELERGSGQVHYQKVVGVGPAHGWLCIELALLAQYVGEASVPAEFRHLPPALEIAQRVAAEGWASVRHVGVPADVLKEAMQAADDMAPEMRMGEHNVERHIAILDTPALVRRPGLARLDGWLAKAVVQHLASELQTSLGLQLLDREPPVLARNDPESFVPPHVDMRGGAGTRVGRRILTAIYYPNPPWSPCMGGALRIWPTMGPQVDVWPEEDSLVLLRADTCVHEVRTCHARRLSFTLWFAGSWEWRRP